MSRVHALLAARHAEDIYIPECLMGSAGSRILDAWVLLPTWSPFTTIGYEVKLTRSDWVRDQKFLEYRPVCHQLIVAAERGVVERQELPAGVGLLEPVGTGPGARLVMRVKPARVDPDPVKLVTLMGHVLMWRTRVQHRNDRTETRADRVGQWKAFLDERKGWRDVGCRAGRKMRNMLTEALAAKAEAERQAKRLDEAASVLREYGVERLSDYGVRHQVERAVLGRSREALTAVNGALHALTRVKTRLEEPLLAPQETDR